MILIVHIIIALTSVIHSTFGIFSPSEVKLKMTYWLMGGTLATGVLLGFEKNINLGHACLSGIVYVCLVSINILLTKRRLATIKA